MDDNKGITLCKVYLYNLDKEHRKKLNIFMAGFKLYLTDSGSDFDLATAYGLAALIMYRSHLLSGEKVNLFTL